MSELNKLIALNEERWAKAKLTRNFVAIAKSLVGAKPRYQSVEKRASAPWWVDCGHSRARVVAGLSPLTRAGRSLEVSTHVPAGRGPFKSWEDAAVDALVNCDPHLARKEWKSAGECLTNLEAYNGLGYFDGRVTKKDGVIVARYPSQPSPYIWAGAVNTSRANTSRMASIAPAPRTSSRVAPASSWR